MSLSTRDFAMRTENESNVLKSQHGWYKDGNQDDSRRRPEVFPPSPPASWLKNDECKYRGKSWADRMDDQEVVSKRRSQTSRNSCSSNNSIGEESGDDKENSPIANKFVVKPLETDIRKLQTRQRQIDIGKETVGYKRYITEVRRKDRTKDHPRTPNRYTICSTRSWQGTVRVWRRKLHYWDTPEEARTQQRKFSNILTSPYMFEEDNSNDEEEPLKSKSRRIDNSIDNEDCISEGSSQNSSEGNDSTIMDEPITEGMLFWSGI